MATAQSTHKKVFISNYFQSLSQTPHRLRKRMLATWTPDQELNQVRLRSGADMKRKLRWYDLVAFGIGGMLGVGVFVTTGPVARKTSGPSVFISYIIAGISALLSSLCYTEFSVEIPVAGGAFSYLRVTFGEFVGYFAGANILMEYVLSNAAVFMLGLWRGIAPHGIRGVLDGAAIVYFSYIGYDSVSTLAEEIQNPPVSLPVGIVGSVVTVSALYCLMALALCMMVPYNQIAEKASYSMAFQNIGLKWAGNVVGAGASMGIVASLLVAMLGQARYLCVIGRARLVPSWLSYVHPSRGTPLNATLFLEVKRNDPSPHDVGLCTASIALFTDLDIVIGMISIGTLSVFYLVANATIYRKYVIISQNPPFKTLSFLFLLTSSATGFSVSWKLKQQWWGMPLFGGLMVTMTALFQYTVPCVISQTSEWSVPFMPWPAAVSIFLNVFLMTTLKKLSFQRFGVWACLITVFYLLYGVHATFEAEEVEELAVSEVTNPPSTQLTKLDV
ncbi:hypothetical protein V6N11_012641 [Hibiscus sabdariffa]|uniref:Cationic amino acid transporter C-terminal domain-containing protein n=1 Tax=Hibiscus sabdariffa TaxID=183260 RepID=A0ABR2QBQ6_9ROSI